MDHTLHLSTLWIIPFIWVLCGSYPSSEYSVDHTLHLSTLWIIPFFWVLFGSCPSSEYSVDHTLLLSTLWIIPFIWVLCGSYPSSEYSCWKRKPLYLLRNRNFLRFASTWFYPQFQGSVAIFLLVFLCFCFVCHRSVFCS